MRSMLRKAPSRFGRLDRKLVRAVSGLPGGSHDDFFRRLSAAANKGKLWFGIAAVMALFPGRTRRAAAPRGAGAGRRLRGHEPRVQDPAAAGAPAAGAPSGLPVCPSPAHQLLHALGPLRLRRGVRPRRRSGAAGPRRRAGPPRGGRRVLACPHRGPLALGCVLRIGDRCGRRHGHAEVVARAAALSRGPADCREGRGASGGRGPRHRGEHAGRLVRGGDRCRTPKSIPQGVYKGGCPGRGPRGGDRPGGRPARDRGPGRLGRGRDGRHGRRGRRRAFPPAPGPAGRDPEPLRPGRRNPQPHGRRRGRVPRRSGTGGRRPGVRGARTPRQPRAAAPDDAQHGEHRPLPEPGAPARTAAAGPRANPWPASSRCSGPSPPERPPP